jgi:NTP pyrophosphatase (non-canonical NTP hydrolase)
MTIGFKEYADWVEGKIITSPEERLQENFYGLVEELGEVSSILKRYIRDGTPIDTNKLTLELGDTQFYLTSLGNSLNISLVDVIEKNVQKLDSRQARNKIKGSGDNR